MGAVPSSSNASLMTNDAAMHLGGEQKYITLALPTGSGGETQYCQVPADPRVISGQYSYAIMPQGDGTSQIILIENSSFGIGTDAASEGKDVVEMEVPAATIFDNEYEGQPWKVDITLMYAEAPLPFGTGGEADAKKEEKKEKEKPLKELLQEVDKGKKRERQRETERERGRGRETERERQRETERDRESANFVKRRECHNNYHCEISY